jgi:gamma-glutamylcyclotransferase (GGCT)/AIG2-like uncharacterized protein YtfP
MQIDEVYFAYGSNLHCRQMQNRCPTSWPLKKAVLKNHELCFPIKSGSWRCAGVAGVRHHLEMQVHGMLYVLSKEDLDTLDRYEGHPCVYKRREMLVHDENGQQIIAWTYLPRSIEKNETFKPSSKYLDRIIKGALEHHLPAYYLEFLRTISTVNSDPSSLPTKEIS